MGTKKFKNPGKSKTSFEKSLKKKEKTNWGKVKKQKKSDNPHVPLQIRNPFPWNYFFF